MNGIFENSRGAAARRPTARPSRPARPGRAPCRDAALPGYPAMNPSERPGEIRGYSYSPHHVVAIIEQPENVALAVMKLERKGFAASGIKILAGADAARRLDATVAGHGFSGWLMRFMNAFRDAERKTIARQAAALRAGHSLVGVPVRNAVERIRVEKIIRRCRGRFIKYFSRWSIADPAP